MIEPSLRMITDYIGAGRYLVEREGVFVGTDYGVQHQPYRPESESGWKAELGSRCIGVDRRGEGLLMAGCTGGVFLLADDGTVLDEKIFSEEVVYRPVLFGDGVLIVTELSLQYFPAWSDAAWTYEFSEALGQSVKGVRVLNLFAIEDHAVLGVVDYDSGVGRVFVFDKAGTPVWMSEPGPLSEVFPAGNAVFVWCLSGYDKFESHMTRLDGHEIWTQDFAGVGSLLPDGSLAMVIGTNESPKWDHWEYRRVAANGKVEQSLKVEGRSATRPLCTEDGAVYFVTSTFYLDPTSSRVDYTSFLVMPQEALHQHLHGIRTQIPEYDIFLQRIRPDSTEPEMLYELSGSYSLAKPKYLKGYVFMCDGPDLIGLKVID